MCRTRCFEETVPAGHIISGSRALARLIRWPPEKRADTMRRLLAASLRFRLCMQECAADLTRAAMRG
jgi:hypothetical protein